MKTLKMVLKLGTEKTTTISLASPKDGLTKAEVQAALEEMVADEAIIVSGVTVSGIEDFYVWTTERTDLV